MCEGFQFHFDSADSCRRHRLYSYHYDNYHPHVLLCAVMFLSCVKLTLKQSVNMLTPVSWLSGVRQGTLNMENCVLQCETTGVIVRTSARLNMNMCDLYGSKVRAAWCRSQVQTPPRQKLTHDSSHRLLASYSSFFGSLDHKFTSRPLSVHS